MSLASLLRDAASRVPNKPALYMKERVLTYTELDGEAQRLARGSSLAAPSPATGSHYTCRMVLRLR